MLQLRGSGTKGGRTIHRKVSCFRTVSALGEIWHVTIFWISGIPDSQSIDDNEPIPENISVATTANAVVDTAIDRNAIAAEDWGFDGVDKWRISGGGVFLPQN